MENSALESWPIQLDSTKLKDESPNPQKQNIVFGSRGQGRCAARCRVPPCPRVYYTASIGRRFVLSERVIKAKAWILAVLGTVVTYDLTQTSEDPRGASEFIAVRQLRFAILC